jgi:HEAT repeat protein
VVAIERLARTYLETLDFPNPLHGAEEDVMFWHAPRYHHVMRDLAESWEALGRYHEAAGLWRRNGRVGAACGTGAAFAWQEQVKAVIRDEEIDGRCDAAVAERLLDVGGSPLEHDDPYGPKRLMDARFDVPRLLRGALLTLNRDAGESAAKKAIDELPEIPRLFAQMRLREKGLEDWERRLQASRGLADVMQEAAIPLLLQTAEQSLPPGRQRAISALGDLAERPPSDPCGKLMIGALRGDSDWVRPVRPLEESCKANPGPTRRNRLARALSVHARDRDAGTREAVAVALGKIAAPSSLHILKRLTRDSTTDGTVCSGASAAAGSNCHAHYPVREAARQALHSLNEIERTWHESITPRSVLP